MNVKQLTILAVACTLTLGGCASGTQEPVPANQQPGQSSQWGSRIQPGPALQTLPASSWQVLYQGRSLGLQDALVASGKKAAIFQFAGVTCTTCQADAKEYSSQLQGPLGSKAAHFVVFTDFFEDFQEQDFADFIPEWAPRAIRAHDDRGKLWISLQQNQSKPDRNVIVVLGQNGRGMFTNLPHSTSDVIVALQSLVSGN
jgi:hypothetical protein